MEGKDVRHSGSKATTASTSPTSQSSVQSDRAGDAHEGLSDTPLSAVSRGGATVDDGDDGDDAALSNHADAAPVAVPSSTTPAVRVRRKPVPRKGHTKSRKGCLSCKRRRVKCPETLPECDNCRRLGLSCHYPKGNEGSRFSVSSSWSASSSSSGISSEAYRRMGPVAAAAAMLGATFTSGKPTKPLSVLPTSFSIDDMRFFQHFLCTAYPPLPIEGNDVWKEVAAISHEHDYLLHAMLALGASHLTLCATETPDYSSQALSHRVQSINALNQALCRPCASKAEGDARFATVMALTFQSAYMREGMLDFLSMVRGCIVISGTAMPPLEQSAFHTFSTHGHQQSVRLMHSDDPTDQRGFGNDDEEGFANRGLESVRALGHLCRSVFEVKYLAILEDVLERSKVSYVDSYSDLCVAYYVFEQPSHEEFRSFIDPTNYVAQILISHFFLMEWVIGCHALEPIIEAFPFRGIIASAWIHEVAERLPDAYEPYIRWALAYSKTLKSGPVRPKRPLGT